MIIGITGTTGAGKGTVAAYLAQRHGFRHASVRAYLEEHVRAHGRAPDRAALIEAGNKIRARFGPGHITRELVSDALARGERAVVESVRSVGEAHYLLESGAQLWAVDAPIEMRYARIVARASATDSVSFEEFARAEVQEHESDDPHRQNISGVMSLAHMMLRNDGTIEDLHARIEEALLE